MVSYKSQVWYTNLRALIDSATVPATFIIQANVYNTDSQSELNITSTTKNIEVDIPLLTAGASSATYTCLSWETTGWSNTTCAYKSATTTQVTCSCSKLGEVSAVAAPTTQNPVKDDATDSAFNLKIAFTGLLCMLALFIYH